MRGAYRSPGQKPPGSAAIRSVVPKCGCGVINARTILDVSKRATLLGVGAIGVGLALMYLAVVWWSINGLTAMETADGRPSGPLNGYGVLTVLAVPGLGLLVFGIRRVALGVRGRLSDNA